MLPQEVDRHVHQLHSIQGASAQVGAAGRMGADAFEFISDLVVGQAAAGGDTVDIAGMPGQGDVQLVKDPFPRHKRLAGTAFLTGAAVVDDGAGQVVAAQVLFDRDGGAQGTDTQVVVAAAVAGSAGNNRLFGGGAGLLVQAGEGVKLTQEADDRVAGAVPAGEGGGDVADVLGDLKPGFRQGVAQDFHRAKFLEGGLRAIPNLVTQVIEPIFFAVDDSKRLFFIHVERSLSFCRVAANNGIYLGGKSPHRQGCFPQNSCEKTCV